MKMHPNQRLMLWLLVVAVAMLGVSFAFIPLYRLFCQAFNIPIPRVAVGEVGKEVDVDPGIAFATLGGFARRDDGRTVEVRFVAEAGRGVPIRFAPMAYKLRVRIGEPVLTAYTATNTSPVAMDGVAVHMVYGMGGRGGDVVKYIDLRQCFCFELQHYPGMEEKKLPLNFIILPGLPEDIHTITFAYTLYKALPNDARIRK